MGKRKSIWSGTAHIAFLRAAFGPLLLAPSLPAAAQEPKKVFKIGYRSNADPTREAARSGPIRLAPRELGHLEGENIAFEFRYAEGKFDRYRELAADLVRTTVDVIVAAGGDSLIRALMNATKTIPIVLLGVGSDPVEAGFVASLARPGGNVTCFTNLQRRLGGKRLELLKEVAPKATRIAVLYDPGSPGALREVKEDLPVAARALMLTVRSWEIKGANDFDKVFPTLNKERPDGLFVPLTGDTLRTSAPRIAAFALRSRLPSKFDNARAVITGGLMYYGADQSENYRRSPGSRTVI